jgi:hypothetical protein
LEAVTTDVLLWFFAACRPARVPGRPGPNVVRIDRRGADRYVGDGESPFGGVAGLFGFRSVRHPARRARGITVSVVSIDQQPIAEGLSLQLVSSELKVLATGKTGSAGVATFDIDDASVSRVR